MGATGGGPPVCTVELCNGVDDDCDGVIDEDSQNAGADCITGLPGICKDGTVICDGGALACVSDAPPQGETCGNNLDDDCDGIIDDGCVTVVKNGCSDGTREGFVDEDQFPLIAGCSGGWDLPGLIVAPDAQCNHEAGNTSTNPAGKGCSAADLCAPGFHVCKSANDVAARAPGGCGGVGLEPNLFFATRQGSTGCAICTLGTLTDPNVCTGGSCATDCAQNDATANDLFGCGSLGMVNDGNCGVLDRTSGNICGVIGAPWWCGANLGGGYDEANVVIKLGPEGGGVLCCVD